MSATAGCWVAAPASSSRTWRWKAWRGARAFGQLGLVAKRNFGDTMLAASLAAGYGQFNISRSLFNGATAASVLPQWMITGQVRAPRMPRVRQCLRHCRASMPVSSISVQGR